MAYDNSDDMIFCPLVDENIDGFDCMEYQCFKDESIPDEFKQKADWKTICKNCKYREY